MNRCQTLLSISTCAATLWSSRTATAPPCPPRRWRQTRQRRPSCRWTAAAPPPVRWRPRRPGKGEAPRCPPRPQAPRMPPRTQPAAPGGGLRRLSQAGLTTTPVPYRLNLSAQLVSSPYQLTLSAQLDFPLQTTAARANAWCLLIHA